MNSTVYTMTGRQERDFKIYKPFCLPLHLSWEMWGCSSLGGEHTDHVNDSILWLVCGFSRVILPYVPTLELNLCVRCDSTECDERGMCSVSSQRYSWGARSRACEQMQRKTKAQPFWLQEANFPTLAFIPHLCKSLCHLRHLSGSTRWGPACPGCSSCRGPLPRQRKPPLWDSSRPGACQMLWKYLV